jgi:hypothetical protein
LVKDSRFKILYSSKVYKVEQESGTHKKRQRKIIIDSKIKNKPKLPVKYNLVGLITNRSF